jgi:hypothetical protein
MTGPLKAGSTFKKLDWISFLWKFTTVKTLTADDHKRIRIPDAKPRQVYAYSADSDGTVTLKPIKAQAKEMFPPGSLLKYMTPERDKENEAILAGCVTGPE